ncbi:MAG: aconitase/3-isopropylmalate dehydratase large subunit family protein [bacterium]
MAQTIIEKILSNHADGTVTPGDIADIRIDARIARDFGGANVVKNIRESNLGIDDPQKTFFTFDCNPTGSDQKYASNQQICRVFAREHGIRVFDIESGIGTHIAIDEGLVVPGGTLVSTDSHANILGAIGAFGQGMGDQDIAATWAYGKVWYRVPPSIKVILKGTPPKNTSAKDVALRLLQEFGASGLLGCAAELYGDSVDKLSLNSRITIASMATEMGGIILLFPPNDDVLHHFKNTVSQTFLSVNDLSVNDLSVNKTFNPVYADKNARYDRTVEIDLSTLEPLISQPGHPEDVVPAREVAGTKIDSAFIGSCTNGRFEDMKAAAEILEGRKVAPGVVLKIVPATRKIWQRCLDEGFIDTFMKAGALVGNAGCAGCAAGQIGQNGPGEVTVSTGNRNFAGKQGKGDVYLASPETAAASAVAGVIAAADSIPKKPSVFKLRDVSSTPKRKSVPSAEKNKPTRLTGRVWVIGKDNIDTDMIFHNRYLAITDIAQMGQYTFDNLKGWEDFARRAKPGDIVITGANFGAGSSRQQAVDCFKSLGVQTIIAKSFGAIYERNAINAGLPIVTSDLVDSGIQDGETITIHLEEGKIIRHKTGDTIPAEPFSDIQMKIYQRGGLLSG